MFAMPRIFIGEPTFFPQIRALEHDVNDMQRRLSDFREPLLTSLQTVIIPSISANFAAQGRPKWKPLALATVISRRGRTGPILHRTGTLLLSVTSEANWVVTKELLTLNYLSIPEYGAYHQTGTRKMPARPFVMYQPQDVEAIALIFESWVGGIANEEWGN